MISWNNFKEDIRVRYTAELKGRFTPTFTRLYFKGENVNFSIYIPSHGTLYSSYLVATISMNQDGTVVEVNDTHNKMVSRLQDLVGKRFNLRSFDKKLIYDHGGSMRPAKVLGFIHQRQCLKLNAETLPFFPIEAGAELEAFKDFYENNKEFVTSVSFNQGLNVFLKVDEVKAKVSFMNGKVSAYLSLKKQSINLLGAADLATFKSRLEQIAA